MQSKKLVFVRPIWYHKNFNLFYMLRFGSNS